MALKLMILKSRVKMNMIETHRTMSRTGIEVSRKSILTVINPNNTTMVIFANWKICAGNLYARGIFERAIILEITTHDMRISAKKNNATPVLISTFTRKKTFNIHTDTGKLIQISISSTRPKYNQYNSLP
jgi:hypothetical protein